MLYLSGPLLTSRLPRLKGLEDEFDGKNRKNPRHFIINSKNLPNTVTQIDLPIMERDRSEKSDQAPTEVDVTAVTDIDEEDEGRLRFLNYKTQMTTDLARIPSCAIFHKLTAGKGVPHSFYGDDSELSSLPVSTVVLTRPNLSFPFSFYQASSCTSSRRCKRLVGYHFILDS